MFVSMCFSLLSFVNPLLIHVASQDPAPRQDRNTIMIRADFDRMKNCNLENNALRTAGRNSLFKQLPDEVVVAVIGAIRHRCLIVTGHGDGSIAIQGSRLPPHRRAPI